MGSSHRTAARFDFSGNVKANVLAALIEPSLKNIFSWPRS